MISTKIIDHTSDQFHRSLLCQIASNHSILKIITCLYTLQADVAWKIEEALLIVNSRQLFTKVVIISANY